MRHLIHCAVLLLLFTATLAADGLLVSSTPSYPSTLLRNRMTRVTVHISGLVAETVVDQEFVNDWSKTTDAVYAFPMPADARPTALYYWRHDTLFQAVLRVQEQVITPGTGEGDVPAAINSYIGKNGLKIELKGIEPWTVQRVELHYLSLCDFSAGEGSYSYPLASGNFIRHPLELVEFRLTLDAGAPVEDYVLHCEGELNEERPHPDTLRLHGSASKSYITSDITFSWRTRADTLAVEFFSDKADTADGYYALLVRPPDVPPASGVTRRNVVFCLERSSRMYGIALEQSKNALLRAMDGLSRSDAFNIVAFESSMSSAFPALVTADSANKDIARAFVSALTARGGSQLEQAMAVSMGMLTDGSARNFLIAIGTGRAALTPEDVSAMNTARASVIMIGMGTDADRSRLELIAARNGGYARILPVSAAMGPEMERVLRSFDRLVLRDVIVEYPEINIYGIQPAPHPSIFAGMPVLTAGRYRNAGPSSMTLAGEGPLGFRDYTFRVQFAEAEHRGLAAKIWAKLMIDAMEREIDVYGPRQTLKDSLIAVSLASGIRCRYTAYIADYVNVVAGLEDEDGPPPLPGETTRIIGNYPNPFNPATVIQVYIAADRGAGEPLFLAIYDMLGRLVRLIDLSRYAPGLHTVHFDGRDARGNALPSGSYTLVLSGTRVYGSRTMLLLK
ncbi:MAG: VIT domain-containing protein [Bacteroidia bacterium]|nr:VIT domain-containing protein [Bacteroidia bacterium]